MNSAGEASNGWPLALGGVLGGLREFWEGFGLGFEG